MWSGEGMKEKRMKAHSASEEPGGGVLGGRDLCERIRGRKEIAGLVGVINNIPW